MLPSIHALISSALLSGSPTEQAFDTATHVGSLLHSDMGNTATADTDTDLDTKYVHHVKAKNSHSLSDVSKFARVDTSLLSGNTASATLAVHTGRLNSTMTNTAHQHGGARSAGATRPLRSA